MPIFEYKCRECDHCFEQIVLNANDDSVVCPQCGHQSVERLMSAACSIKGTSKGSCAPGGSGFS